MKESFRQAGTINEFHEELETIVKRSKDILIWQTDQQGKRVKVGARILNFKIEPQQTLITVASAGMDNLKKKLDYFIYDEADGILFKGNFLRADLKNAVLRVDDNVFLKEKRMASRHYFQFTKVFVDVNYGERLNFHNLLLRDISEDGFGLLITGAMSKALLEGMTLGLIKIHSVELPRPLEGKIIHRTVLEENEDPKMTKVRLGVKFHKKSKLVQLINKAMGR